MRTPIYVLCFCLLNVPLVGCATSGVGHETSTDERQQVEKVEQLKADYIAELRRKPPEELTEQEIEYLRLINEKAQADSVGTLSQVAIFSFVLNIGLAIFVIASG